MTDFFKQTLILYLFNTRYYSASKLGQKDVETEDTHTSAVKLLGPDFKSREMESKTQRQFLLSPQTQGV